MVLLSWARANPGLSETVHSPRTHRELPQARVGAATEQGDALPAIAGNDGPVRAETVAERLELLRRGRGIEAPRQAVALPDPEVVDGPDVEPAQLEHQVHLGGPPADAPHGDE